MLILQFIIYLHSQKYIHFKNSFSQSYITKVGQVSIEVPSNDNINGGQCGFDIKLNGGGVGIWPIKRRTILMQKYVEWIFILYFLVRKLYPCLFLSNNIICMVYLNAFFFLENSHSKIEKY